MSQQSKPQESGAVHHVHRYGPGVLAADAVTACMVGFGAAIPISIIDYSIIAKVSGVVDSSVKELGAGVRTLFLRPHKFFLPCAENKYATVYRLVTTVYLFTYLVSNTTKSLLEPLGYSTNQCNLGAGITSGIVNIGLTVWKDSSILRLLPPKNEADRALAKLPVPTFSRLMFATRDMLTCIAAFTIAPMVSDYLRERYRQDQLPLRLSANDWGQIVTPAVLQMATTVVHITGIRYHRTQGNLSMGELAKSLKDNYVSATLLRVARIIPAFGIGGIFNRQTRYGLLDKWE